MCFFELMHGANALLQMTTMGSHSVPRIAVILLAIVLYIIGITLNALAAQGTGELDELWNNLLKFQITARTIANDANDSFLL